MALKENQTLCGFKVTRIRDNKKLGGVFVEMVHEKTGAELCWVDNKTENKLFCIGFKTIPENSTGVFHILEHSVLCGSDKYPVREPFVELLKSSMNTFLNAMTYPDKTIYPVSSRNTKDFMNLTEVYLDAVFAPALLHNPNIFYQEGRHIELSEDGPSYVGVVFNEMKGVMSSVDDVMELGIESLLFPDTCYKHNSGGDPTVIPDLTYEEFVDTYKRFYHPSNSRIFLDGDIPLEETLSLIDSYLSRYKKKEIDFDIALQKPVVNEKTVLYDNPEEGDDQDYLVFSKIIGSFDEPIHLAALNILLAYLVDNNESPFKKAILSEKLAKDLQLCIVDGIKQPYALLCARNTSIKNESRIKEALVDATKELLKNGIPKEDLVAILNKMEFDNRQIPEPQGLYRASAAYNSWLYGGDPLLYLDDDVIYGPIRKMLEDGTFETYLKELFTDFSSWCTLRVVPSATYGEELEKAEHEKVSAIVNAMSEQEVSNLKKENASLSLWQQTPDTPEQLATIPTLPLSEVSEEITDIPNEWVTVSGKEILFHRAPLNGVTRVSLHFPLTEFTLDELSKLAVFVELINELPTKEHSVTQLQRMVRTYIGNLSFHTSNFARDDNQEEATPCFVVSYVALDQNVEKAGDIVAELLNDMVLNCPDRIRETINQLDEAAKQAAMNAGHSLAMGCARSHFTAVNACGDATSGYTFLKNIRDLSSHFEDRIDDFVAFLEKARRSFLNVENAIISVSSEEMKDISKFLSQLPHGKAQPKSAPYSSNLPKQMGIIIPSQVSYAGKAYHLNADGFPMDGSLMVAGNILSLSYLWNRIRVQGGAYGAGMGVGRTGLIQDYTYRDPSPMASLVAFDEAADFLEDFVKNSDEDLDKFIISQMANADPLKTPLQMVAQADGFCICGVTHEKRVAIRREMLHTTKEALLKWVEPLRSFAKDGAICVVGNEQTLKENPGLTLYSI